MRLVIESDGNRYPVAEDIENLELGPFTDPITPSTAVMIGHMFRLIDDIKARKAKPKDKATLSIGPNPFHEE